MKILQPKRIPDEHSIFYISAYNIHCVFSYEPPRRGGSYEYPQSIFLTRNKKKTYIHFCTPCKLQFYYIKVGFKGVKITYIGMFSWSAVSYYQTMRTKYWLTLRGLSLPRKRKYVDWSTRHDLTIDDRAVKLQIKLNRTLILSGNTRLL